MPNGDPAWGEKEYPILEAFFGGIAEVLHGFAREHNLAIEKYYHQSPAWHFRFSHPKGGFAYVRIGRADDYHVEISGVWWFDDKRTYTRLSKQTEAEKCPIGTSGVLRAKMDAMLSTIISWRREDLAGKPNPRYKKFWERERSKEELELEAREYPIPKLD